MTKMKTTCCPRCRTALDEGPVVYRCATCRRAVYAADLDRDYVPAHAARTRALAAV